MTTNASACTIDRLEELNAFDKSKSGVKGLVDAGLGKVPQIFVRPPEDRAADSGNKAAATRYAVPTVDFGEIETRRTEVLSEVKKAAEEVGFIQLVNHGVPESLLEEMLAAARAFHEQPNEVKERYYSRDLGTKVRYWSNFDLYKSKFANWRDTLVCRMGPESIDPQEIPPICRDVVMEYSRQMLKLGTTLFQLLSEALGLDPNYLIDSGCAMGHRLLCHYYPACPEPELAMGTNKHSDPDFLTILLQDQIGGLQVFHENQWIDIDPRPGVLVINIGDLLQIISNDKFKSNEHRVRAKQIGPRLSIACFFTHLDQERIYGPAKELLSEENPPVYRETTMPEYVGCFDRGLDEISTLTFFKLKN